MQQNEVVMNNTAIKSSEQRSNVEIDLEDGPLFRATIKEYESRTSILKGYLKRILKTAASSLEAKNNLLEQDKLFIEALREAPFTEPLFAHYLNSTWDKLHEEQERLSFCMQNLLISPLQKLYDMDIKTVDNKKRQFEDVSKEYYSNLSRYLSIKTPNTNVTSANSTSNMNNSNTNNTTATVTATTTNTALNTDITKLLKEKRNQKAESEFLTKKSEFDLVRFDYYTFLRDLHGGKKEQEILYHLLNHHEKQYAYYQSVAKLLEPYKEGLDELANMIAEASREQKIVNQERDEKRKLLVSKYATTPNDDSVTKMERRKSSNGASSSILSPTPFMTPISPNTSQSNSPLHSPPINTDSISEEPAIGLGITNVDQNNKFKGIRDLQQQDQDLKNSSGRRKEGFLFATSKPIKNTNATAFDMSSNVNWHKYWCVLSGGQLHEYSNWKKHLETHIEPINLRFATVREARNADRRFCFEVITPNFRRMYQATSNEELSSWVATINNAISSLLNGLSESSTDLKEQHAPKRSSSTWKQAKSLSGALSAAKDKYLKKRHHNHNEKLVISPPLPPRPQQQQQATNSIKADLLVQLRKDLSNTICADCSAKNPDWCSLNLGILICIECSGIHRSLGTHISKVRSLTLDSASFTPDIVQLLLAIGNAKSNAIWESQRQHQKPSPTDTRETKLKYIQLKYVDKAFVVPVTQQDPMDILYDAIAQDNIPQALYAIALGADVNQPFNDNQPVIPLLQQSKKNRSSVIKLPILDVEGNEYLDRRTMEVNLSDLFIVRYALHFALLPHTPSNSTIGSIHSINQDNEDSESSILSGSSNSSTRSSSIHTSNTDKPQRVFGMAEFLFQNGADVAIEDKGTGRLLADLIGLGYLVDDEAITYLNMKNSLRGQSAIIRTQEIPPPISS